MLARGKQLRRHDLAGSRRSLPAGSFWVSRLSSVSPLLSGKFLGVLAFFHFFVSRLRFSAGEVSGRPRFGVSPLLWVSPLLLVSPLLSANVNGYF